MLSNQLYNEEELLSRVSTGDESAFATLYHHWSPFLSRYLYRLTESSAASEEILQDVFMKIWNNRETLAEIHNFKAFLLIVTRNQAYMALRSKARYEKQVRNYQAETMHTSIAAADDQEYFSVLDEAIDQLSDRAKEVYILSRQQRLSYAEIADQLGISKETVKTYLQRATTSITAHLKSKFPDLAVITFIGLKNFL